MNLRYARTFVAVAELGTVSKASQHLRIAQPALSRQINAFEGELGLQLFDRVGSRLVLTGEGEQLLRDCRILLNYATTLGERAQLLRKGDTGVLRVASSPQFIEGAISEFLRTYSERYPNVAVKLVETFGWPNTLGMLERGEVHLGQNLLRAIQPGDQRYASHPVGFVDLLAVGRPAQLTAKGANAEIAMLVNSPLLVLDTSFIFRRTFDAACSLAGIQANIMFESRTPHTLLAMAEAGHGVAIVPSALRIDRYPLRIARVTYQGKPLREPLAIFWDARRPLPHYAAAFCEMLAAHVRKVFPISRPPGREQGAVTRRSGKRRRL